MNILILEDDPNRHKAFRNRLIGTNLKIVETAAEAIAALNNQTWDYLFLDHDLGGMTYVTSGKGTGYEVAEWLAKNESKQPSHIILHTLNPVGAQNMQALLPNALRGPFAWTKINIDTVAD